MRETWTHASLEETAYAHALNDAGVSNMEEIARKVNAKFGTTFTGSWARRVVKGITHSKRLCVFIRAR